MSGAAPRTHFPDFDVLAGHEAWDAYTRSVVLQRLRPPKPTTLTGQEVQTLRAVLARLLSEERDAILDFAVAHIDRRVRSAVGEGQRKPGVPPEADLVRLGLAALELVVRTRHGQGFAACEARQQVAILSALQKGEVAEMQGSPQKELFKKLLGLGVDACASHPAVWSEMGYAGPAYPRGYYRLDRGVRDPWEPRSAVPHRGETDMDGPAGAGDDRATAGGRDGRADGTAAPGQGGRDGANGRDAADGRGRD